MTLCLRLRVEAGWSELGENRLAGTTAIVGKRVSDSAFVDGAQNVYVDFDSYEFGGKAAWRC